MPEISLSQACEISTGASRGELVEEPHVVLDEEREIVDPEAHHRDPVDPEPEGEAGVALGIDADRLENGGMNHAGAAELEPPGLLAGAAALAEADPARDVELAPRLDEREVAGAQADLDVVTEEHLPHRGARAPEVRHRDPLVDDERLELVEHRKVGGVEIL